jgi:hypothetical protein
MTPHPQLCNHPPMKRLVLGTLALAACQPHEVVEADLCNAPFPSNWQAARGICHLCDLNLLEVRRNGKITWNGARIDEGTLRRYLKLTADMVPRTMIRFDYSKGTPCGPVRQVRTILNEEQDCSLVGDFSYCQIGHTHR